MYVVNIRHYIKSYPKFYQKITTSIYRLYSFVISIGFEFKMKKYDNVSQNRVKNYTGGSESIRNQMPFPFVT